MRRTENVLMPQKGGSKILTLGIENLDQPVYRIFNRLHFEDDLRLNQLTFVRPEKWDDPMDRPRGIQITDTRCSPLRRAFAKACEEGLYAQCWSTLRESDTLWRAYSHVRRDSNGRNKYPEEEGILVSTTLQKLVDAFNKNASSTRRMFVGHVVYEAAPVITQFVANQVCAFDVDAFVKATEMAALLLHKREAFAHESEVRLFIADTENNLEKAELSYSIDPSSLF